jgi:hypothetical protein
MLNISNQFRRDIEQLNNKKLIKFQLITMKFLKI